MTSEKLPPENETQLIHNPEHAKQLAESTKKLRDAAATLRSKAIDRRHEGMTIGDARVDYTYVQAAYRKKAATLDTLADLIEADAGETMILIEQESDSVKRQLLLHYQLLCAKITSNAFAFFQNIDALTPADLDYARLQKEAQAAMKEQEQRQKKGETFVPRPPRMLLRLAGMTEEEIDQWL